jgi:hypothetical protein
MGPVARAVTLDGVPALAAAVAACLLCAALAMLVLVRARRRKAALDAELDRSRHDVETLSRKVAELSDEVGRARRRADLDREYVVTSLGREDDLAGEDGEVAGPRPATAIDQLAGGPARVPVGKMVEDQLVQALARQPAGSAARDLAVQLVVRTVAVGHGVRRALSPEVRDRAMAEANVARRRSRRERKRQVREARRLVRAEALAHQSHRGRGRNVA